MIRYLDEADIDYCVVGGLAVLIHAFLANLDELSLRSTRDADLMFTDEFTNADFSKAYLSTFADDAELGKKVYETMFGESGFTELSSENQRLVNCSFLGPREEIEELNLPDFDVVRYLNGYRLEDLEKVTVNVLGTRVTVASPAQLLDMKTKTVELLSKGSVPSPHLQDYADIQTLRALVERSTRDDGLCDDIGDR